MSVHNYYFVDRNQHIATQGIKPIESGAALETLKDIEAIAGKSGNSHQRIRQAATEIFNGYQAKYEAAERKQGFWMNFAWASMYQRAQVAKVYNEIISKLPAEGESGGFLNRATLLREKSEAKAAATQEAELRVEKHSKGLLSAIGDWWNSLSSTKEEEDIPLERKRDRPRDQLETKERVAPSEGRGLAGRAEKFSNLSDQLNRQQQEKAKRGFWGSLFGRKDKAE